MNVSFLCVQRLFANAHFLHASMEKCFPKLVQTLIVKLVSLFDSLDVDVCSFILFLLLGNTKMRSNGKYLIEVYRTFPMFSTYLISVLCLLSTSMIKVPISIEIYCGSNIMLKTIPLSSKPNFIILASINSACYSLLHLIIYRMQQN